MYEEPYVPKSNIFSNMEEEKKFCEEWEKVRQVLLKHKDRIEKIYITKEAKS